MTLVNRGHGDADALLESAIQYLVGSTVPRDLGKARAHLRDAAALGQQDAATMEIALVANGSGAPADWTHAVRLLEALAPTNDAAARQIALLQRMSLRDDGMPAMLGPPERLCESPEICRYRSFASAEECAHLAAAAQDLLAPAMVAHPVTGALIAHPIRTSETAVLGPTREDLVVQALLRRIAAASGTRTEQGEPLNVLRYAPGQQYRLHSDALPQTRNQRILTALLYLNDGYGGGATAFPDLELDVAPRAGDLLLFANTLPDGRPDPVSRHAGLPVTRGTKWVATRWIRAERYDVWNPVG